MDRPRLHWIPERKFLAGGLAGIAAWLVSLVTVRYLGIEIPPELLGPIIVSAGSSAYYLVPPSAQDVLRRIDGDLKAAFDLPAVKREILGIGSKMAIAFLLLGGLALGGPAACASYTAQQAEQATVGQKVYALQVDYNAAALVAVAYLESGHATPAVTREVARLDRLAFSAVTAAADAARGGDNAAIAASAAAARAALAELVGFVEARRRTGAGGPPSPPVAAGQGAGT